MGGQAVQARAPAAENEPSGHGAHDSAPACAAKKPAAQSTQAELPSPGCWVLWPGGHSVHEAAAGPTAHDPAAQGSHAERFALRKCPSAHTGAGVGAGSGWARRQLMPSGVRWSSGGSHGRQDVPATTGEKKFTPQLVQVEAPVEGANRPAPQGVQLDAPGWPEEVPGGHRVQEEAAATGAKDPAAHGKQPEVPLSPSSALNVPAVHG